MGTGYLIERERMNILVFDVSNVGKTTIGRILAGKLGYDFYDLDEEVKYRWL